MRDARLGELVAAHMALPFPRELAGEEIEGIDLVMLDADTTGVASHYVKNCRPLSPEHKRLTEELLAELDRILPSLLSGDARAYYRSVRAIGAYLLASRDIRRR